MVPPPTRGWSLIDRLRLRCCGGSPAHAGMVLERVAELLHDCGSPAHAGMVPLL